tara:strand:- start:40529 stop:41041 length:513 start_codon:yes stop_codon:yes gene_type:complete
MSLALIRRALILALIAALAAMSLVRLGSDVSAAVLNAARLGDVHSNADGLQARLTGLDTRLVALRQSLSGRSLPVADAAAAEQALQALIQASLQGGTVLSLRFDTAQDGIVGAELLWRGSEHEMRTTLESLAAGLPVSTINRLNLRAVTLDGDDLIELDIALSQMWERTR